jgi:hypothetical protein
MRDDVIVIFEADEVGDRAVTGPIEKRKRHRIDHRQDDEDGEEDKRRRQEQKQRHQAPPLVVAAWPRYRLHSALNARCNTGHASCPIRK